MWNHSCQENCIKFDCVPGSSGRNHQNAVIKVGSVSSVRTGRGKEALEFSLLLRTSSRGTGPGNHTFTDKLRLMPHRVVVGDTTLHQGFRGGSSLYGPIAERTQDEEKQQAEETWLVWKPQKRWDQQISTIWNLTFCDFTLFSLTHMSIHVSC